MNSAVNNILKKAAISFVMGLATTTGSIVANHVYKKSTETSKARKQKATESK